MPDNIPAIEIPVQPIPNVPDSTLEKVDSPYLGEDLEGYRKIELQRKEHELIVERVMLKQRRGYAFALFGLSAIWLLFIGGYLILAGRGVLKTADAVLIALISTTTANVLGLFYIVARWLFPNKSNSDKDSANKAI